MASLSHSCAGKISRYTVKNNHRGKAQHFSKSYCDISEVWYFSKCHYMPSSGLSICVINDNDCHHTAVHSSSYFTYTYYCNDFFKGKNPGWCGSVVWALACEPKGCWFDSQSGHIPGLQLRSPTRGTWEATTHRCFSPSFFPSFPLSKINK